ncbi:hypothetical protein [Legionella tunisiensis]|uniref:hypothetical protein n=1 Tax=Legionella tunisiensis TaxID=1034944 RepID=UPI0002D41D7F|nr:hypothetical protein [Legionella tunisiensis]
MENVAGSSELIHKISEQKYELFSLQLKNKISDVIDLHIFKNDLVCTFVKQLAGEIFFEEIQSMLGLLNEVEVGVVALDVPHISLFAQEENVVFGVAVVIGVFNNIGTSNLDPINQLPFMIHTASYSNEQQLEFKGLEKFTPQMKLGFHNDGLLSPDKIEIPEYIVVYNLYLSYRKPGNFMWVPTALWEEREKYELLAKEENVRIKIKLNPNYHVDATGDIVNTITNYVEVPISQLNKKREQRFFLNGQVLPDNNSQKHVEFVQNIRDSLEKIL